LPDYTVGDGEEPVYRLTFSNPEKFFYEVDLVGEELADMVEESVLIKNKP
jgi:hypothetical protein